MVVQNSWTTSQDLNRSHLSLGGLHGRGLAVPICTRPRGGLPERGSAASLKGGGVPKKGEGRLPWTTTSSGAPCMVAAVGCFVFNECIVGRKFKGIKRPCVSLQVSLDSSERLHGTNQNCRQPWATIQNQWMSRGAAEKLMFNSSCSLRAAGLMPRHPQCAGTHMFSQFQLFYPPQPLRAAPLRPRCE